MSDALKLRVLDQGLCVLEADLPLPLEIGRQRKGEPEPCRLLPASPSTPARLIIAGQQESNCSRQHLLLEPLADGRVRVSNRSQLALQVADGSAVPPSEAADLAPPFSLMLPPRTLAILPPASGDAYGVHGLDQLTIAPEAPASLPETLRTLPPLNPSQINDLVGWLQTTMGVIQSTVGSADFLNRATAALVQIVGLHSGRVLLLDGDAWRVAAAHGASLDELDWRPSRRVLELVRSEKKTYWQHARPGSPTDTPSLERLQSVVAAPILAADGHVVGALYGERRVDAASAPPVSGKVAAVLVELLACGVATGLARQAQERAALEAQVRFEQFFGPDLARRLAREPNLLNGRDSQVTVLFCDVRGFSKYSEQLGPAETMRWMNDVMGTLSECVLAEGGVLVDYIGDELIAMWGAPEDQPDQATRGARTALAMLDALAAVNRRWQPRLGGPTALGVGLNSGPAQVGNTGSTYKFKYGPLGNTVNLASRVQGLTKYLKCRLLVTWATREQLGDDFLARRVCKTRVVNIVEPVDLYEVAAAGSERQRQFFAESEEALDILEAGDFATAARKAGTLLLDYRDDGPLLLVLYRASAALMQDGRGFDPVWEPPGK